MNYKHCLHAYYARMYCAKKLHKNLKIYIVVGNNSRNNHYFSATNCCSIIIQLQYNYMKVLYTAAKMNKYKLIIDT